MGKAARFERRKHSGGDVVRSPPRSTEDLEPPRTPVQKPKSQAAYHHLVGSSSPETLAGPQPRRLLPDAAMSFGMFGNEEAEQKELLEMFMGKVAGTHPGRGWGDCENRPLSSVSTSAGATPSLDEQCRLQYSPAPSSAAPTPTLQEPLERFKNLPPLQTQTQVRKVFVGGIPQWMTQEDLAAFFSTFGTVSKAWLQRQRLENGGHHAHSNVPVHRGFGFVVFQDPSTVDELLGSDPWASRFLEVKDGKRVEIKRAKTSTDMTTEKHTYAADTSFAKAPSIVETNGQGSRLQSQWCSEQLRQKASNGNSAETNGGAFWSSPWSCNSVPQLMPWFGDAKDCEKMVNPKPCQLQPLQEQRTPVKPMSLSEQMAPLMSTLEWVRSSQLTQEKGQEIAKMLRAAMPDHYDE